MMEALFDSTDKPFYKWRRVANGEYWSVENNKFAKGSPSTALYYEIVKGKSPSTALYYDFALKSWYV